MPKRVMTEGDLESGAKRQKCNPVVKKLWSHQRSAIAWMIERESPSLRDLPSGGILGDEMGLGKTASILGLILMDLMHNCRLTTLVIVPSSLLHKWRDEWFKHFSVPPNSVLLYHGESKSSCVKWSNRQQRWFMDPRATLVITTYGQVLADQKACQKLEAETGQPGAGCLDRNGYRCGILTQTIWHRIVLDESHLSVQNYKAKRYAALCQLQTLRRWAVTGTVHTNSWMDVAATCAWINVPPYNDPQWWRLNWTRGQAIKLWRFGDSGWHSEAEMQGFRPSDCKRKTLAYILIRNKDLIKDLPSLTVEHIQVPFSPGELLAYDVLASNLKRALNSYLSNRRQSRINREGQVELVERAQQPKIVFAIICKFLIRLRQFCNHSKLARGAASTTAYRNNIVFREEACCFECSVDDVKLSPSRCGHLLCPDCIKLILPDQMCSYCSNSVAELSEEPEATQRNYLKPLYSGTESLKCPHCLGSGHADNKHPECALHKSSKDSHHYGAVGYSGKFMTVLSVLDFWRKADQDNNVRSPLKVVIFSQWVSTFNLLEGILNANGYPCIRFTGETVDLKERNDILKQFASDNNLSVLLCGLKVGGVGLDLVMANKVIMMEPWYNSPVEKQAEDRTHRMGQTRPVHVVKLTVKWSVEDWMLSLQKKKLAESQWLKGEGNAVSTLSSKQFSQQDLNSLIMYLCRSYYKDHREL